MPPSRRRPVQPATRVRLPRSARPPAGAAGPAPAAETGEPQAGQVKTEEAPPTPGGGLGPVQDEETVTAAGPAAPEDADDLTDSGDLAGQPDDGELPEPDDEAPATGTGGSADRSERNPMLLPACLGALAVTLGSLAIWFGVAASSTGSGVNTQNIALTDTAATAQVNRQIDQAFSTVFSYNYADTAKTLQAARTLLTGQAVGQYERLFKVVEQQAPKEKLVLTTTVTNSGVEQLTGGTARVLIFADQRDTSSAHQTTDAGAMLAINAVRVGGQWKISSIDTFSSGG